MDFRILGPFEVTGTAGSLELRGVKRRSLLAYLVTHPGQPISADRLVSELWRDGGSGAVRTVQTYVSQLRRLLDGETVRLDTRPGGYVLEVDPAAVDASRFERAVTASGTEADPVRRLALLDGALELWRGRPLGEFEGTVWADREATWLEALRLQALQRRCDALIDVGRAGEAAAQLEGLVRIHPLDERFWALLMLALYRSGRQADAIRAYQQARHQLLDELGIEPGQELVDLEHRILDHDPTLGATAPARAPLDGHGGPDAWPSGVVTFVMTDIEGSTRMLRRLGRRYDDVIDRHDELLRHTWEEHDGAHVSARGDSCLAAFGDARSAVEACADAQRRLAAEPWPPGGRTRVRMGVHTGLATPRDGDYVALAVHQTARVMSAAHGGQVLASETAVTEIGPLRDVGLGSVGRYRLRDFDEPVELFCLTGPGLDTEFPAVRAMPVDGHNLAVPPTTFVGREDDVRDVMTLTGVGRLVTLTGPGGVGKTRLALAVGLAAAPHWDDGVWLVDASSMQDAHPIATTLSDLLGVTPDVGVDAWQATLDHLHGRRSLLVLDNCEHLAAEIAAMVTELLARCPDVGVLATSREPLGLAREVVWRVDPLEVPAPHATVDEALDAPSVRLFVERTRSARPGFALDDGNVQAVVQVSRRLDGVPLALELAAAQTSVMSLVDLAHGLDDRFRILRSRKRGVPDRQRTMEAVMDWSYRLLTAPEQAMLRRLSVFQSGFSLDAAIEAGADLEGADAAHLLWTLVDKSLVVVDVTANETRYRQLETVRAYARQMLEDEDGVMGTARRVAAWWLERIGPWHRMDRACSGEIEVELDNLRALVPLIAEDAEEQAQQLACSIGHYYYAVHAPCDATDELARNAADLTSPSPARVSLLATLALLFVHHGDPDAARRVLVDAEQVRQAAGGAPTWDQVAIERASGEVAIRTGDHTAAAELARRALERDLTAPARARMLNLLAIASYFLGDVSGAQVAFTGELEVARQVGDEHLIAVAEGNVAEVAMRRGDTLSAALHQAACLDHALALGSSVSVAYSLIGAARLTAQADPSRAARLHAKAESVLAENGHQLYDDDLRASQDMLEQVAHTLGDVDFRRARDTGRSLTLLDAATLAGDALSALSE
jgi:predicted ATPase/DNA-binding SARP family transcriptional activator/class 3 adenylate cyclase